MSVRTGDNRNGRLYKVSAAEIQRTCIRPRCVILKKKTCDSDTGQTTVEVAYCTRKESACAVTICNAPSVGCVCASSTAGINVSST